MTDGSNRLPVLASEIKRLHGESKQHAAISLAKAIEVGELLREAKAQVKHGEWLPWLREHCELSERSAQDYMRLAKQKPEIEKRSAADLTIRGALAQLTGITDEDVEIAEIVPGWIETKLARLSGMPDYVVGGISCELFLDLPALSMVPSDDLFAALKAMAPIVKDRKLTHGVVGLIRAQRVFAMLWGELIEARKNLSEEDFWRRADDTAKQLIPGIEEAAATWERRLSA